jgi:hypothetical protein
MKRLCTILILLALMAFPASVVLAVEAGEIHYGMKAGVNISTVYAESGRAEFYVGGVGGIFMNYAFSGLFQIQPEVLFSMRGWKESAGPLTLTSKINYIDIDALLKLAIPTQGRLASSFGIGPYIGIKVSDCYEYNMTVPEVWDDATELIFDNLQSYDIGFVLSGETDIIMDNGGMIVIDGRLTYGFKKIFEDIEISEDVTLESLDYKNLSIMFTAGYAF